MKPIWKRKSWTANPADPTAVTQWTLKTKHLECELLVSWGVEARSRIFKRRFWSYDRPWAIRLYRWLEDRYERTEVQGYDDNPMSRYF